MAGHADEVPEGVELKGLSKHFNSYTMYGRANTAKATYAVIGLGVLFWWATKKKAAPAQQPAKK